MSNPFTSLALALALALPLSAAPQRAPHAPQRPVNLNTATVTELKDSIRRAGLPVRSAA